MRFNVFSKLCLLQILSFYHTCMGNEIASVDKYKFRHLTVVNGLSSKWVKCIYRDRAGYLWIGTADGLNRYDGINIRVYKFSLQDTNSINHNFVTSIYEDRSGVLWVGTQVGLNKYDRRRDCFQRIKPINNYISCFYELPGGTMYIGSPGGLYVMSKCRNYIKQVNNNTGIESIVRTGTNHIWIGAREGLFILTDTITYEFKKLKLSNFETRIRCLFVDHNKQLWIGTESSGLFVISNPEEVNQNFKVKHFVNYRSKVQGISNGTIYSIIQDAEKNVWIGIENGGVNIVYENHVLSDNPKFVRLLNNPFDNQTIGNNSVHALFCDNQKTVWVGTYGNGISYTNALLFKFKHYRQIPYAKITLNNNFVNAIFDERDYTYVGTEGGLNVFDKRAKKAIYYTSIPEDKKTISSNVVWSIYRDSKHNLWIGTWNGGLNLFNESNKTFERIKFFPTDSIGTAGNSVTRIIESNDGKLWIATMGRGLFCYDYKSKKFTHYRFLIDQNSLSCNWIFDLAEDKHGRIWIASTEAVDVFDRRNNRFHKYTYQPDNPRSISYNGALVLFRDSRDNMWIGTSNGLNVYDEASNGFIWYSEKDGLANSCIKSICEDNKGNIWVSTNRGISKFVSGVKLSEKPTFINYNVSDGLQENEFNARAVFKNEQGYLFFGGPNGYNFFHPDSLPENQFIPPVVFTDFFVYNTLVRPGDETGIMQDNINYVKEIKLKKRFAVFTVGFAALNLIAPEKNQYAYFLEGIDKSWNFTANNHYASYTYLPPGRYKLHVKAANNDGRWNEKANTLNIVVLPAWYESTIAKIIYLMLFLLALYVFRKYTLISVHLKNKLWLEHKEKQKLEELGELKLQFFTNISHELRTPLTLILNPLKRMIDSENCDDTLRIVYRNAFRLKTLVDQILDFSKLEKEMMKLQLTEKNVVELVLGTIKNFAELAQHKAVRLTFNSNVAACVCKIDEDKLDKVMTNLISNSIKNTPSGGKVTVDMHYSNNLITWVVSDTGTGIAPDEIKHIFERFFTSLNTSISKPGTGIGLNLSHKLIELMGGRIDVESIKGKGTQFSIYLPVMDVVYVDPSPFFEQIAIKTKTQTKNIGSYKHQTERKKIMIVDDDDEMGYYLSSILSAQYEPHFVNSSIKALEIIGNFLPDLIISDVMMNELDGFEFCAKIKSDIRFSHIPVILLTAKSTVPDKIQGYETGADEYITKPFDDSLLLARIDNLLTKKENIRRQLLMENGELAHPSGIHSLDYAFMEKVMQLIQQNYADPNFNVNNIIEKMGISRSVFYAKLKSLSNQSVNDIITNYRIKKSIELLKKNHLSISEVAMDCGFNDPAYFSRVFKQIYGISPKDFRNQLFSNNNNNLEDSHLSY
ncbi:MAG: ATP-binding protein [Bacteroidales bacterium]|nr:ATP-binding protein [Bacteroidales bacterium]